MIQKNINHWYHFFRSFQVVYRTCSLMDKSKTSKDPSDHTKKIEGGVFRCHKCSMEEDYHYKGQVPPFCRSIKLLEDSYIRRDPFCPPSERSFLVLGSDCSVCEQPTCQDSACSVFYTKRFCLSCAERNLQEFPTEIQSKIQQSLTKKPCHSKT